MIEKQQTVKEQLFHYIELYGADEVLALNIAWCESRFDPKIKNKSSSAGGVFQFIDSTWEENCSGNKYDAEDNIRCGVKLIAEKKITHWVPSYSCWRYLPYTYNI